MSKLFPSEMKILVTGAHFTPAKAVIEEFLKKGGIEIIYVGRRTTMEGDNALSGEFLEFSKLKIKYLTIIAGRLRRSFDIYTVLSLFKIPVGIIQAFFIVLTQKPDVILSFGGYVSVPVVLAGWLFSVPVIIHEQGLTMGLANKISSIFADKIAVSFEKNSSKGKKEVFTGNPLREEILHPQMQLKADYQKIFTESQRFKLPVILVMGGNQGSHAINLAVEGCLAKLAKAACVIHQTGQSKFGDFERLEKYKSGRYLPIVWVGQEIGYILSKADLVICRAGINTLTEISHFRVPALCIPIPGHFEQNLNADYFEKSGLVKKIPQNKLSPASLMGNIKSVVNHPKGLQIAKESKGEVFYDGAKRLALETIILAAK